MIARAPGKVVLSGAYAVLEGAPAVVMAVDRYVTADASRAPEFVTPEVEFALGKDRAPWFDASALRQDGKKLGLGSSAAILVASLAASWGSHDTDKSQLRARILPRALTAHRAAQQGGSGIDVQACTLGGTLVLHRHPHSYPAQPAKIPKHAVIEVWASGVPASTANLVSRVLELKHHDPREYSHVIEKLTLVATQTAEAWLRGEISLVIRGLQLQAGTLDDLGAAAGAPIVTDAVRELGQQAGREGAAVLPAGAGGGDICLFVGTTPPSGALGQRRDSLGHRKLEMAMNAPGVHWVEERVKV